MVQQPKGEEPAAAAEAAAEAEVRAAEARAHAELLEAEARAQAELKAARAEVKAAEARAQAEVEREMSGSGSTSPGSDNSQQESQARLQKLMSAVILTGKHRDEYQSLTSRFPTMLEVGGAIQEHKDQADYVAGQAYQKIYALLQSLAEQTGRLSDAMMEQHEALKEILENPQDLADLLRSGRSNLIAVLAQNGPVGAGGGGQAGSNIADGLSLMRSPDQQAQAKAKADAVVQSIQKSVEEKTRDVQRFVEFLQSKGRRGQEGSG